MSIAAFKLPIPVYYACYFVQDATEFIDWPEPATTDGLLQPHACGVQVGTRTEWSDIAAEINIVDQAPERLADHEVEAECSIFLPSGVIVIDNPELTRPWSHDFLEPTHCGIRVAARQLTQGIAPPIQDDVTETHSIHFWKTPRPVTRWHSPGTDLIQRNGWP